MGEASNEATVVGSGVGVNWGQGIAVASLPVIASPEMLTLFTFPARTCSRKMLYGMLASGWLLGRNNHMFQTIRANNVTHHTHRGILGF